MKNRSRIRFLAPIYCFVFCSINQSAAEADHRSVDDGTSQVIMENLTPTIVEIETRLVTFDYSAEVETEIADIIAGIVVSATETMKKSADSIENPTLTKTMTHLAQISHIRILTCPKVTCLSGVAGIYETKKEDDLFWGSPSFSYDVTPTIIEDGSVDLSGVLRIKEYAKKDSTKRATDDFKKDSPRIVTREKSFEVRCRDGQSVTVQTLHTPTYTELVLITPRIIEP